MDGVALPKVDTERRRGGCGGGWLRGAWPVLVLTLLAALLRLCFLDRPGIWNDESATYGRVNGSFWQLLEVLQNDGFAPLHYELYFFLARFFRLVPWVLRLWPAIAGTAMVPAVYFMARQLASRRTALLACLLACTSAYLLYYSRDAKMYAPLWLFVTLSMACFCWWLNTGKRLAWWLWVLCTMAALGIHTPGASVLLAETLALAVHRSRSVWHKLGRLAAYLLGIVIIAAGPVYHYTTFNRFAERIDERGWNASMLQWVGPYNQGRHLPELLRSTASEYSVGWEWPDKRDERAEIDPRVLRAFQGYAIAVGAILALGFVPWRRVGRWIGRGFRWAVRRRRSARASGDSFEPEPASVPTPSAFAGAGAALPCVFPRWGPVFVLAAWIVLPAYAVYVKSFDVPAAPWGICRWVQHAGPWAIAVSGVAVLGVLLSLRNWKDAVRAVIAVVVLFGTCCGIYEGIWFDRTHVMREVTLYSYTTQEPAPQPEPERPSRGRTRGPAAPVAGPTARPATRPIVTVAHDVKIKFWSLTPSKYPTPGRMVWMPRYLGASYPAVLLVAAVLLRRLPIGVREICIAGIVGANLANHSAKLWVDPEPPVGRAVADAWDDMQRKDATATSVVFLPVGYGMGVEPGTGTVTGFVGRYYLSTRLDPPMDPPTFRSFGRASDYFLHLHSSLAPRDVQLELKRRPNVTRIVTWGRGNTGKNDPVAVALSSNWKLDRTEVFRAYDHWKWLPLTVTFRNEYVKTGPDPAPPAPPRPVISGTAPPKPSPTTRHVAPPSPKPTTRRIR